MKKTKKLLVICMVITLLVCTVMPTFSWYNRAGSSDTSSTKGASIIGYEATVTGADYNGEVTLETYKGEAVDHNVVYDDTQSLTTFSGTIENDSAAYYKTVIRNNSTTKSAKVNLFLKDFSLESGTMDDKLFVGCTSPVYNKQAYSPKYSTEKSSNNTIRIYFQPKTVWSETKFYLFYYDAITSREGITMTACPKLTDYQAYYADIPANCTGFFITCENNQHATGNKRTPSIKLSEISLLGGNVIGLPGGVTDYDNVKYEIYSSVAICNVKEYYSKLYGNVGCTDASVALTSSDYTGKSISYSSSNTNVATVSSSGKVSIVAKGTATITTTITSVYGDTLKLTTAVESVDSSEQIPIVENLTINANSETEVCWFIKNETGSQVEYVVKSVDTSL